MGARGTDDSDNGDETPAPKRKKLRDPLPLRDPALPPGTIVWVRLMKSPGFCTGQVHTNPEAVAFQVAPAITNIDGLKDAVKLKMQLGIAAPLLMVFAPVATPHPALRGPHYEWCEVMKASANLKPNTEETAYRVCPSKSVLD